MVFNSANRPENSTYKPNVFNRFLTFLTNFSVNVNIAVDVSVNSSTTEKSTGKDLYHIEISQLIYSVDQSNGLCMMWVFEKVV